MDQPIDEVGPLEVEPALPRGHPFLAWAVILGTVAAILYLRTIAAKQNGASAQGRARLLVLQMQARALLGAAEVQGRTAGKLDPQVLALDSGPPAQRFRFIVLAGELGGPDTALGSLQELTQKLEQYHIQLTPIQADIQEILGRLYADYAKQQFAAPSVQPDERHLLRRELGWFGDLALTPAGGNNAAARQEVLRSAERTFWTLGVGLGAAAILGFAGLVGLVIMLVLLVTGSLQNGITCGSPNGRIYAETFALWMVVFFCLSGLAAWKAGASFMLLEEAAAMLLSLVVLAWPVVRGVPWRKVRQDIGFTFGRQPAVEPLIGLGCYAMAIPVIVVALVVVLVLMGFQNQVHAAKAGSDNFGSNHLPVHPIIQYLAAPDWWHRFQLLLLASVVAPLVEETMFRGVLYRHLREASARLGAVLSVLASALVVSFIFAVIHPQGFLAIPALMALAVWLALVREWRGTLVPSMVIHGVNNGLLMLVVMLALGD